MQTTNIPGLRVEVWPVAWVALGSLAWGLGCAARRQQVGEGALEVGGLGQHRHDGRADAGVLHSLRECGSEE